MFFSMDLFFSDLVSTYLQEYRHFSIRSLGFVASLPLFAGMIGDLVGGSISDSFIGRLESLGSLAAL